MGHRSILVVFVGPCRWVVGYACCTFGLAFVFFAYLGSTLGVVQGCQGLEMGDTEQKKFIPN